MNKVKRTKAIFSIVTILLLLLSVCAGCTKSATVSTTPITSTTIAVSITQSATGSTTPIPTTIEASGSITPTGIAAGANVTPGIPSGNISGEMIVSYIDVGQADSILIQQGSASMLIDAGNNADANLVVSFIKSKGITKLDYVIGTHPHEDHVGGLDAVIAAFEIGKVILPDASSTTATFEDVLNAIQAKGLKITKAVAGNSYTLNQASITILGPVLSSFENLNDASVVCKITFGSTSFLFEGDAESTSESSMISKGYDLRANVVKIGHHGSDSSTSAAFLESVAPQYAVICVGANNQYRHPTSTTLAALKSKGINVFRTDLAGTITAISTGSKITFSAAPNAGSPGSTAPAATAPAATAAKPVAATTIPAATAAKIVAATTIPAATAPAATAAKTAAATTIPAATAPAATAAKTAAATTIPAATAAATTAANPGNAQIVYITATGTKYHRDGCRYLSQSKIEVKLSEALAKGLTPCSVCNP